MIFAWRIGTDPNEARIINIHYKNINFNSVTFTSDCKLALSVGSDRCIREITLENAEIKKNVDIMLS
jgi:hypothetical protein